MADDGRLIELHLVEERREELSVEVKELALRRLVGAPERRHVERDHAVVLEQAGHHPAPRVGRVAVAVDQQNRRPIACVGDVGPDARYLDEAVGELVPLCVVQTWVSNAPRQNDRLEGSSQFAGRRIPFSICLDSTVARILIVGCGCKGLALADALAKAGHPVRGTTRDPARVAELEAAGVEPAVGDPYRLATLMPHVANTSAMVWLMGSARGDDVAALHRTRLQTALERLVDTPVRGVVYEAAGTLPAKLLREGATAVRKATVTWQMPNAIVEQDPRDHMSWLEAMVAGVEQVLAL